VNTRSSNPVAVFIFGIGVWSASLCQFLRGPSRIRRLNHSRRPALHRSAHFGNLRNQLAGSERPCKLVPDLGP